LPTDSESNLTKYEASAFEANSVRLSRGLALQLRHVMILHYVARVLYGMACCDIFGVLGRGGL
jgi:hypothetical protein